MNMPDKDMKGQGWKETLESWEPKVDAGGWEALQQRVPSGNLFRVRQWVEGSAVKAARMLGKATFVKVAAVAAIATALPGDLIQRATTNEPTAQIASKRPVMTAIDSSKSIRYTLAQQESSDSGNTVLSNNTTIKTPQDIQRDRLAEPKKNQQEPLRTTVSKEELLQTEPKEKIVEPPATTNETVPPTSTRTEFSSRKGDNSNNRRDRNKPAITSSQPTWASKKTVTNKKETLLIANNAQPENKDNQEISVTEVKQYANQKIDQKQELTNNASEEKVNTTVTSSRTEKPAVISNPSATTVVIDSTALVNITPTTDSLGLKAKVEEPAREPSRGTNLSFYKAISVGGGIFTESNASGGYEQANFHFGANYGKVVGARFSTGISTYQRKANGDSIMVADTDGISHLEQSATKYRMQQLTFGLDLSQRIWGNESTTIYLLEGIRGSYLFGESPVSGSSSKITPFASARLSVAIYRRIRYGLLFVEPSLEYQTGRVGILTKGTTAFGITVGWCF